MPKTAYPKATGTMRSTTCCTCPLPKPFATTTTSTATVPPLSCPTADKSTICITAADTCTKSASTTKSLPKSNAHRVNSPTVTNSIPSSPKKRRSFRRPRRGNQHIQNCSQTLPIAKHPCPHWHVATAKMDRNIMQKRNNGNGAFSWKPYKDNVTEQHRK